MPLPFLNCNEGYSICNANRFVFQQMLRNWLSSSSISVFVSDSKCSFIFFYQYCEWSGSTWHGSWIQRSNQCKKDRCCSYNWVDGFIYYNPARRSLCHSHEICTVVALRKKMVVTLTWNSLHVWFPMSVVICLQRKKIGVNNISGPFFAIFLRHGPLVRVATRYLAYLICAPDKVYNKTWNKCCKWSCKCSHCKK